MSIYSSVEVFQIEKVKSFVDDVAFYCTEADISYKFDNFKLTGHDKSCELAITLKDDLSKTENSFNTTKCQKDIEEIITSYEYYVKDRRPGPRRRAFGVITKPMIYYLIRLPFNRNPMAFDEEYDV